MASTLSSLTLDGALLDETKATKPLKFIKLAPLPEDFIHELKMRLSSVTRLMPKRQECTNVPTPAIHHDLPIALELSIGEYIAEGRSGIVFAVEPLGLSHGAPNAHLPPLVAKIGRQHYSKWLLREAWFYEEMRSVQGIAIPWCYGLYYARVPVTPGGPAFIPWLRSWQKRVFRNQDVDLSKVRESYERYDGMDSDDRKEVDEEADIIKSLGAFGEEYGDLVKQFEDEVVSGQRTTVITMLILERLGEAYLPLGGMNWPIGTPIPEDVKRHVFAAYSKIHELGILHMDIKRSNVLKACIRCNDVEEDDDDDTSTEAAGTGSSCGCRIIDFELSKKTNFTREVLDEDEGSYLDRLIDNLPEGMSIGQHT